MTPTPREVFVWFADFLGLGSGVSAGMGSAALAAKLRENWFALPRDKQAELLRGDNLKTKELEGVQKWMNRNRSAPKESRGPQLKDPNNHITVQRFRENKHALKGVIMGQSLPDEMKGEDELEAEGADE